MDEKTREARIREIEAKYGIQNAPRSTEVLTRPTEESALAQTIRLAKQLPRGMVSGAAGLASIPSKVASFFAGKPLPGHRLSEDVNEYLDVKSPGSAAAGFHGRAIRGIGENIVAMGLLGRASKLSKTSSLGANASKMTQSLSRSAKLRDASNLGSAIGSGYAAQTMLENKGSTPLGIAMASMIGSGLGGVGGRSTGILKAFGGKKASLAEKDLVVKRAIESYKDKTSNKYKQMMTPIETILEEKRAQVELSDILGPLKAERDKLKTPAARKHFMKETEEGKILTELSKYPKKIDFNEALKVKEMIQKRADRVGAFNVTKTKTGSDLSKINHNFKKALEKTVEDTAPKLFPNYKEAQKLWSHRKKNIDPLIDDILGSEHLLGDPHKTSLRHVNEGATHSRFILENLTGKDKKAYARDVLGEMNAAYPTRALKKAMEIAKRSIHKVPEQHRPFYESLGKSSRSLASQTVTPKFSSLVQASLAAGHEPGEDSGDKAREARIREIEAKYGMNY